MNAASGGWLAVYPARYQDARGVETTTIRNDGRTLWMTVRGLEFSGSDFDALESPLGLDAAARASFSLVHDCLADCTIEWEMPLAVVVGDRETEAHLDARLRLGRAAPRGGIDQEILCLVLRWESGIAESRERGWFEDAMADLQALLPGGVSLRCCFGCAFSDYSIYGHGLFGSLACFRDNKDDYLAVRTKNGLARIWPTMTEYVQETFVCPQFQRRIPGTGYRG